MRPNSDVNLDINFDFELRRAERRRARFIRVIFRHYLNRIRRAAKPETRVVPTGDVWARPLRLARLDRQDRGHPVHIPTHPLGFSGVELPNDAAARQEARLRALDNKSNYRLEKYNGELRTIQVRDEIERVICEIPLDK